MNLNMIDELKEAKLYKSTTMLIIKIIKKNNHNNNARSLLSRQFD